MRRSGVERLCGAGVAGRKYDGGVAVGKFAGGVPGTPGSFISEE